MKQQAVDVLVGAARHLEVREQGMKEKVLHDLHGHSVFAESSLESPSDCELQVFEQLGHGLQTCEIAEHLHLGPKTVCAPQGRIKDTLSVESTPRRLDGMPRVRIRHTGVSEQGNILR
jgi:DNA-binding NarL/FixJ family response regulator